MRSPLKPITSALLDEGMLDAFGFEHPSPRLRSSARNILKFRGFILRFFPHRQQPNFYIDSPIWSYPDGYEIAQIGPPENR